MDFRNIDLKSDLCLVLFEKILLAVITGHSASAWAEKNGYHKVDEEYVLDKALDITRHILANRDRIKTLVNKSVD